MASKSGKAKGRRDRGTGTARKQAAEGPSFWDRLPARTRHLVVVGLLLVVSAAFFAPATFQGKRIIGSDTVQSRAMAKSLIDYRESTGDYALWDVNLFSGMPGFMISYPIAVVQIDSPIRWAGRHLWPTVHFFLYLAGVYVLVFSLTKNRLAGLLAALAAGLTTYIPVVLSAGHSSKFVAIAWFPWLLAAFRYTLKRPGWIAAGLFAVVLAAELRAGHPQISYNGAWLIGLWWLVEGVGSLREGRSKQFGISTLFLGVGALAAVALVAQPYFPQFEFKEFTTRGGSGVPGAASSGLAWDYAMQWSQGRLELLTLFVADILGGGSGSGLYWGAKPFTEGPHYVGGIVLLLAIIAVAGRRGRTVWGLSLAALILTLFSLGENAAWLNRPLFEHFPLFGAFRAPEMWLHMVELSVAILAGIGAAYLVHRPHDDRKKRIVLVSAGCAIGFGVLLAVGGSSFLPFQRPGEEVQIARQVAARQGVSPTDPGVQQVVRQYVGQLREQRVSTFESDAMRTVVVLLLGTILIWFYFRSKLRGWALLAGLSCLVLFDLWGVGKRHLSAEDYKDGEVDDQVVMYDFDRFIVDRVAEAGGPGHFRALSLEASPVNWARPAYFYETSGGYNAAKLQVYQDLIDNVLFDPRTGQPTEIGLDLTATRFVVSGRPLAGMRNVFSDPTGMAVWEREPFIPRTRFVGATTIATTREETFAALNDPAFDPSQEALVATETGLDPAPIDSASITNVKLVTFGPREIEWDVETDRPRLLVTSEIFYPAGWTASVDGNEVPIVRTNHAFRGVALPAGRHTVRMIFDPRIHSESIVISTVAAFLVYGGLLLLLGFAWRRRREEGGE